MPVDFSSGSNLGARMLVVTIINCVLTEDWICYVRSPRPASVGHDVLGIYFVYIFYVFGFGFFCLFF